MFPLLRADRIFDCSKIPAGLTVCQEHPFIQVKAEDDSAFLNALSPITGFAANRHHRAFIYRGQRESTWPLVPASRRMQAWPLLFAPYSKDSLKNRLVAEAVSLMNFCDLADLQGLRIPNLSAVRESVRIHWRKLVVHYSPGAVNSWPPHEITPALALAQHSGMRTCLLDFTRNPFIASYFASRDALEDTTEQPGQLCVWIVADPTYTSPNEVRRAKLVIPPASDNMTLQRQEGLFVYAPRSFEADEQEYTPDEPLEKIISEQSPGSTVQVTLDRSFAKQLLHRTMKLGYDSSHLFPTFEGTVRCLKEHELAGMPPTFLWAGGLS
jgi:hypothetical protein